MCYINNNSDTAKVLGVDDCTGLATVVINGETKEMPWDRFIEKFKRMGIER